MPRLPKILGNHLSWRKTRDRQERFHRERQAQPQNDSEFLKRVAPDGEPRRCTVALLIRKAIASQCGVAAEEIQAEDPTSELERLVGQRNLADFLLAVPEGLDLNDFFFELAKAIARFIGPRIHIDNDLLAAADHRWRSPDEHGTPATFGR
jgi:hypothetical protein